MEENLKPFRIMTQEELNNIKTEINKAIAHIARGSAFDVDTIKHIIANMFIKEDDYVLIEWPDIQFYMDKEGFKEHSCLANDEWVLDTYGSSTYFVNKKWIQDNF